MRCPRCNAQLTDDASFCGICGAPLAAPQARMPEARPAFSPPDNNEGTLLAGPLPGGPAMRGPQEAPVPQRSAPPIAPPANRPAGQPGPFQGPSGAPPAGRQPGPFQGPPPAGGQPGSFQGPPPGAGQPGPFQGPPPASGQPGSFQGPPPASGQPGSLRGPSAGSWSPQQQPPAGWTPGQGNQPPAGAASAGAAPARLDAGGALSSAPRKRKRWTGCLLTSAISVVVLIGILVGAWFLGVRPYLHNLAQDQLDQALSVPENQILLSMLAVPPGVPLPDPLKVIHGTETSMNSYLGDHGSDQVQNLHMTITPAGMSLSFTAYGQNCVISAQPYLDGQGQIQVKNVQVQGVLGLIMSNDELTSALNSNLQNFSTQMTHKVTKITLLDHEIDVQLS